MALTGGFWPSLDFHVVRGVPPVPLLDRFDLWDDAAPGGTFPVGSNPPAHIAVELRVGFQPEGPQAADSVSGHGVSVNKKTGAVTVGPAPAGGRRLNSFVLTATATDNDTHFVLTRQMRIQVHDAVTRIWLTPTTLTLRPVPNEFTPSQFLLMAQFDDGVIGEISNWPVQWSTDPPSAVLPDVSDIQIVNAEFGWLIARRTGAHARLNVDYAPLGLSAHAEVTCVEAWEAERELTWIGGKDHAKWREVPNVLFLGEGFVDTEETLFLTLVRNIVRKLRTPTLRPYDTLYDSMNYWAAFIASSEPGFSIRREVYTVEDSAGLASYAMPLAQAPAETAARWNLTQLLYRIGLPVKADATRDLAGDDGLLKVWQRVYGPDVTEARVEGSWKAWRARASRILVNDRNTALGIALAERPKITGGNDTLGQTFERGQSWGVNELIKHLRYRGEAVGETWRAPSGPAPKDHRLVCFLVRSRMGRSANSGESYTSTLAKADAHYVRPSSDPSAGGFEIVPVRLKLKRDDMPPGEKDLPHVDVDDPPIEGVAVVAHETGHSLGLGDEYADYDKRDVPAGSVLSDAGNIQEAPGVLAPDTQKLQSSRIKWGSWHRIQAAGVLAQDPDPASIAQDYRLTLRPGHASAFRENDLVRLRRRPLFPDTLVSDVLRVKKTPAANEAHLDVTVLFSGWTSPGFFKAGSVLMKMVRWPFSGLGLNLGDELKMIAGNIREHLDQSQLPLNARPGRGLAACEPDDNGRQSARNLPDGLPKCRPRNRSRIVGLFEGGGTYHCGVYHPTGACVMRTETMGDEQIPFCPVCRYVMVDLVDPTKHGVIDGDYARIYPDPRL